MTPEQILNGLQNVNDEYLLDAAAPVRCRKCGLRSLRIAVAAACLCAALVGGALAAEAIWGVPVFKPMDTNPLTGEAWNGFSTVIGVPETAGTVENSDVNGVFKQPVESFGRTVRDAAANLPDNTAGQMSFTSWEKAEEFLGVDLMNNSVLAKAQPGLVFYGDGNSVKEAVCQVDYTAVDGILIGTRASSVWYLNYVDLPLPERGEDTEEDTAISGSVPVRVNVVVQSYTSRSPIAPGDMFLSLGFPDDYTLASDTYTTPSGLAVNVVAVSHHNEVYGQTTEYYAQFALNGNAVTVSANCAPDADHALATLKQVLDAFQ